MHPLISDTIISVDIVAMHCNILLLKDTVKGWKALLGQTALLIIWVRRGKRELLMGKVVPRMSENSNLVNEATIQVQFISTDEKMCCT